MLSDLSKFVRYSKALPKYLSRRMDAREAERRLRAGLLDRGGRFLDIMERGVFQNPTSPYLPLLRSAGIEPGDLKNLVDREGLEGTLAALHDAGVYVTLDEVKGRRPIERKGLSIPTSLDAFNNPLMEEHCEARSSGSRGARQRSNIDLGLLEHETAYVHQYFDAFDLWGRPYAVWRPVPPAVASVKWLLRLEKMGQPAARWFSQDKHMARDGEWKFALFTLATFGIGRLNGVRFPPPQHVPADAPEPIVSWLAEIRQSGPPAVVDTILSSAVRLCLDAKARGIDIAGTLFRVGGEPLTEAKARIVADVGCRAVCFYSSTETGFIGVPCANPAAPDDVHLLTDKIAALARPKKVGTGTVDALVYTTLLTTAPKLLLNVEIGDFADMSQRDCGCRMAELGFRHHLSTIRSYDKVTSEGVSFLGTELLRLLEEILPGRFGGAPTDYQFVEAEVAGLSHIFLVASPRLGPLDERAVVELVLETLRAYPGGKTMVEQWRQGQTLRLERREPYGTDSAKILPLFLQGSRTRERTRQPESRH